MDPGQRAIEGAADHGDVGNPAILPETAAQNVIAAHLLCAQAVSIRRQRILYVTALIL
jgi:hypothetical protein